MEKFLLEKLVHYNLSADLSGKMLTFPQETNTAHNHILFSLATAKDDAFVIFKRMAAGEIEQRSKNGATDLGQLWLDGLVQNMTVLNIPHNVTLGHIWEGSSEINFLGRESGWRAPLYFTYIRYR
uniref:Uncharacterized protein n=1 Tax=Hucho hucho TaxID=62062 RepID=A0A4W5LIB9_9TELE